MFLSGFISFFCSFFRFLFACAFSFSFRFHVLPLFMCSDLLFFRFFFLFFASCRSTPPLHAPKTECPQQKLSKMKQVSFGSFFLVFCLKFFLFRFHFFSFVFFQYPLFSFLSLRLEVAVATNFMLLVQNNWRFRSPKKMSPNLLNCCRRFPLKRSRSTQVEWSTA